MWEMWIHLKVILHCIADANTQNNSTFIFSSCIVFSSFFSVAKSLLRFSLTSLLYGQTYELFQDLISVSAYIGEELEIQEVAFDTYNYLFIYLLQFMYLKYTSGSISNYNKQEKFKLISNVLVYPLSQWIKDLAFYLSRKAKGLFLRTT